MLSQKAQAFFIFVLLSALNAGCGVDWLSKRTSDDDQEKDLQLSGIDIQKTDAAPPAKVEVPVRVQAGTWDMRLTFQGRNDPENLEVAALSPAQIVRGVGQMPTFPNAFRSPTRLMHDDFAQTQVSTFTDAQFSSAHFAVAKDPRFSANNPYRCNADATGGPSTNPGQYDCYRVVIYMTGIVDLDLNTRKTLRFPTLVVVKTWDSAAASAARLANPVIQVFQKLAAPTPLSSGTTPFTKLWEPTTTADGRLLLFRNTEIMYTYNFDPSARDNLWSTPRRISQMHSDPSCIDLATGAVTSLDQPAACPAGTRRLKDVYPLAKEPIKDALGAVCTDASSFQGCSMIYPWISQDGSELFYARIHQDEGISNASKRAGLGIVGPRTKFMQKYVDGPANRCRLKGSNQINSPGLVPGMWTKWEEMKQDQGLPYTKQQEVYPTFTTAGYSEVTFHDSTDDDYLLYLHMNELLLTTRATTMAGVERHTCTDQTNPATCNEARVSHTLTPDTSGNFNTGELIGGARFPTEQWNRQNPSVPYACTGEGENIGLVGRAVYFPPTGRVRVRSTLMEKIADAASPEAISLARDDGFTVDLALNLISAGVTPSAITKLPLFTKGQAFEFLLQNDDAGKLQMVVRVKPTGGGATLEALGPKFLVSELVDTWTHLAVSLSPIRSGSATVRFYRGGSYLGSQVIALSAVDDVGGTLSIGPGAPQYQGMIGIATTLPIVMIDEVALSRGVRDADYMKRQAHVGSQRTDVVKTDYLQTAGVADVASTLTTLGLTPPLGLKVSDIRLPKEMAELIADGRFATAADLGADLFEDPKLSQVPGKSIACASCHAAGQAFTDPRGTSVGVQGNDLAVNAPTIFNRLFSTRQFFNGRSDNLLLQATAPITNPLEMGGTMSQVISYVANRPAYQTRYAELKNCGPSRRVCLSDEQVIAAALTAFEMKQMSGNSEADRVAAGLIAMNGPEMAAAARGKQLFEGKARCASCHGGPNFTDELFHNTGTSKGVGRSEVTRRSTDLGRVKTPTLRGIGDELTKPYFHDGSAADLDAVLDHYEAGLPQANAVGQPDFEFRPVHFEGSDREDLKAYLKSL